MKNLLFILLLLGISALSTAQLNVVTEPDFPERGWWWQPSQSGFGLNCDIQEVNFSAEGNFVFCAIFTYDETGAPKWYTMSGPYIPNEDVFAWREDRGLMGTFTSPLYESTGGSCPSCTYQPPNTVESQLGSIEIAWKDPLNATMTIGGVSTDIVYQYYHAGLQANNADFITDGAWNIHASINTTGFKGLAKFKKLNNQDIGNLINDGSVNLDLNLDWYISEIPTLHLTAGLDTTISDPNGFIFDEYNVYYPLIAYNSITNKAQIFLVLNFGEGNNLGVCSTNYSITASGILKPAVSANTRLYYAEDGLDICPNTSLTDDQKRNIFVSMTRVPQGGDDLANLPAFQNRDF